VVRVNARQLARTLGCDRSTIGAMITDLEAAGRLSRLRNKGKPGLLVVLLTG
jgi:DNA-binding MarR family transcriptional regulator